MLRDVRQGVPSPQAQVAAPSRKPTTAPVYAEPSRAEEILTLVLGKAIVIVPVAAIIAFGLWTGYESAAGENVSFLQAALMSVGSLVGTIAMAFVWARKRTGRH